MFCWDDDQADEVKPYPGFFCEGPPIDAIVWVFLCRLLFSLPSSQQVQDFIVVWVVNHFFEFGPMLEVLQLEDFVDPFVHE